MPIDLAALAGGFVEGAGERLLEFAIGAAVAEALRPEAVAIGQEAWSLTPTRAIPAGTAAAAAAEGLTSKGADAGEAAQEGYDAERFATMVETQRTAPGVPQLLTLWRRGAINDAELLHGLRKSKLETMWDAPLQTLRDERLDPAVIATSVQRGIMHDPGLLPVGPPTAVGKVPPMPVAQLDTLAEAAASGINEERLAALTRIVGLPPAPGELLQLVNRGTIEDADFYRGVAEGNTRNEWGPFLLTLKRRLLTPHEYAELRLRGWIDDSAMYAGAALSGLEKEDTTLLHSMLGRPIPVHQVTTGLARGGTFGGTGEGVPEAFLRSLEEGNLRPEWYSLAYANRYTLPSAFVLRQLLKDGALDVHDAEQLFLQSGWPPELAAKVATKYAPTATIATDKHLAKAQTQLWNAAHRSYVTDESDAAAAADVFTALGVADGVRGEIVGLWDRERELIRRTLTPAQIKKAAKGGTFTEAEAIARLERLGYNAADAGTFLAE